MIRSIFPRGLAPLALLALGGVGLVAACSSGSDSHAAPISSGGSSSADGGSAGTGGKQSSAGGQSAGGSAGKGSGGSSSDAAAAGESADGGNNGTAGAAGEGEPGTIVVVTPGACSETAMWAGAAPVSSVSTDAAESLLSITPDELDIVFMRAGAPFWAHRATPSDAFGTATAVTLPVGYDASAGVALSSDGMTLVVLSSAGVSFGALTRASRTADFSADADASAFEALNQRAVQTLEHFASPVLSSDGKSFIFSGFTPGADKISRVYEALWTAPTWGMPTEISDDSWQGTGDLRPLPTGLSSDSRTLFYYDEKTSKEFARFRDRPDAPLYDVVDLGALQGAAPNSKCDKLYYSSGGDVLTDSD